MLRETAPTAKRHSCHAESGRRETIFPRRSSCPLIDEFGSPKEKNNEDFDMQQIRMLERMASGRQLGTSPAYTNFKVTSHPSFAIEKYGTWRKELVWWGELYFYVPDIHLLSVLGLHADTTLKHLLMKFHFNAREDSSQRTLPNILRLLGGNYLLTIKEKDLKQMDKLMEVRRSPEEGVVNFWLKSESIQQALGGCSSPLSESFLFIRALKSINANQGQRSSMVTFLECQSLGHTWSNLERQP